MHVSMASLLQARKRTYRAREGRVNRTSCALTLPRVPSRVACCIADRRLSMLSLRNVPGWLAGKSERIDLRRFFVASKSVRVWSRLSGYLIKSQ